MNPGLSALTDELEKSPGASSEAIRDRERELGIQFPPDYVEFMLASNGARAPSEAIELTSGSSRSRR